MIGVAQRHNFSGPGVASRGEDCGFVGFRPAVGEERFGELAAGRNGRQLFCERSLRLIGKNGAHVLQAIHLGMHLAIYVVIAVADANGDDAPEEIQILIPVRIPHILIFGVRNHQWFLVVVEDGREKIVAVR